jgi:hypothetical protein
MVDIYPLRAAIFTDVPVSAKFIPRSRLEVANLKDAVPKMHASWVMAYLDYVNKFALLDDKNNFDRLYEYTNIVDKNPLLQMVSIYFPLCINLFVSIDYVRNAAGEIVNSAMHEIKLFFKNWPEHIMLHYLFHCLRKVFIIYIKPSTQDATFKDYISNPFLPVKIDDVLHGFKITINFS